MPFAFGMQSRNAVQEVNSCAKRVQCSLRNTIQMYVTVFLSEHTIKADVSRSVSPISFIECSYRLGRSGRGVLRILAVRFRNCRLDCEKCSLRNTFLFCSLCWP